MPVVLFIAVIPLLISLGHDGYLYYQFYTGEAPTFNFPSLGWIWGTYHEDSLIATGKYIAENISEDVWKTVSSLLKFKASMVAACLAALIYIPALVINMMSQKAAKQSANERLMSRRKKGKKATKYNRR